MAMARWLVEKDGIFVGSSSAVNCMFVRLFSLIIHLEAGVAELSNY
jgi:hypothetical protein